MVGIVGDVYVPSTSKKSKGYLYICSNLNAHLK